MAIKKKKIFPKLKKKFKIFLESESGNISKKDALWLSAWAVLLGMTEWAVDAACVSWSLHNSWIVNWHYSAMPSWGWCTNNTQISQVINWHSSNGSHGSHGSHGSRW